MRGIFSTLVGQILSLSFAGLTQGFFFESGEIEFLKEKSRKIEIMEKKETKSNLESLS